MDDEDEGDDVLYGVARSTKRAFTIKNGYY